MGAPLSALQAASTQNAIARMGTQIALRSSSLRNHFPLVHLRSRRRQRLQRAAAIRTHKGDYMNKPSHIAYVVTETGMDTHDAPLGVRYFDGFNLSPTFLVSSLTRRSTTKPLQSFTVQGGKTSC
jgi:hypothetical protein